MAEGGREASSETRQMEHGQISNTVEVRGFLKNTSQELLELYFENSRRSGGGDMEEVKIRDEVAYITFKDAEVAQRVVSHNRHQVEGQTLTVKLFHPLPPKPCYENRVLIQGLNNAVTEELLRNFLETVTEAEVREFLYGEEEGNVVVTLSDNIDIGQLRKTFQERSIEGAFLKVERVAISSCILVQNIQTAMSHDIVLFYFENKRRSGGGDVERVEMKAQEGYCLVYFEDHSVMDRVLCQSHKVDGADLEVHLHYECLGRRSSRNKSDPYLRISNPVNKDGRIDEAENTDNQSNDEDSSSVSSDPDKESDFIEVQESEDGGTDEAENTDNQSNDVDSSSVSSDPDKESDFIEVQERQESEDPSTTQFNSDSDAAATNGGSVAESNGKTVHTTSEERSHGVGSSSAGGEACDSSQQKIPQQGQLKVMEKDKTHLETEDPFEGIPVLGKEDIEIACYMDGTILFPSKDTHIEESNLIQTLMTEEFTWSKLYKSALTKRKIPFHIQKKGENEQGVEFQSSDIDGATYRQKMKQLVSESGLKVHKVKNCSERKYILNSPFPSVIEADFVTIYRSAEGDDLYFIGLKEKVNIALKEYGLVYLENHAFSFEESVHLSETECRTLVYLNFSKCLQYDLKNIAFKLFPKKKKLVCAANSVFEIETAIKRICSFLAEVVKEELDISSYRKSLLQEKQTQDYVQESLKRKKIACILDCSQENVIVTCATVENLIEAKEVIRHCFMEIATASKTKMELEKLMNFFEGKVKIFDETEKNIRIIVCTTEVSDAVLSLVLDTADPFYSLSPSERDFLSKHCAEGLQKIQNKYNVEITDGLKLQSNSILNTKEVEEAIRNLLPQKTSVIYVDQEAHDFVSSSEGKTCIAQLADDNKAICTLMNAEDVEEDACDNVLCRWYCGTKGQQILLVQGRAADLHVDCLVVPVNGSIIPLIHAEHGIEESADDAVKHEVSNRSMDKRRRLEYSEWWIGKHKGTLKCGAKLYLPVENYKGFIGQNNLREQLINIFVKAATELQHESIGLPLELFDSQKHQSYAGSLLTAAVEATIMCLSKDGNGLSSIYLCTCEKQTIDTTIQKIERILQEMKDPKFIFYLKKAKNMKGKEDDLKCSIHLGQLHEGKVDVLVNTVAKDLSLKNGNVSKTILQAAGQELQDDLKQLYPDGIKSMQIAVTSSFKLKKNGCHCIFHLALEELGNNILEKMNILKVLTLMCLKKGDEKGMSSIAFPALGTGILGYPYRDVAWTMFEAVEEFKSTNQNLKEVKFILHKQDLNSIEAFGLEEWRRKHLSRQKMKIRRDTIKGYLEGEKRMDLEISVQSDVVKTLKVVEVKIKITNEGSSGPRFKYYSAYALGPTEKLCNDVYEVEITDDKNALGRGLEDCLIDARDKRISHMMFHLSEDMRSMATHKQCKHIIDTIIQDQHPFLHHVDICVTSQAELENIRVHLQTEESRTARFWFRSLSRIFDPVLHSRYSMKWTFSQLQEKKPKQLMIQLLSNTQDHLQTAEQVIRKTLKAVKQDSVDLSIIPSKVPNQDTESTTPQKCQDESPNAWRNKVEGTSALTPEKTDVPGSCPSKTDLSEVDQEDIMKLYEERLDSKETNLSKGLSSSSLDEESYSIFDVLKNVSEVEFKALKIIENGFEKINAALSWDDGAIKLYGPSACTISVIKELSSHLRALRIKQVEISLDEEEKNVVKHIIEEMKSKDTICILDEKNSQVVVYTDKQDDILKFKHKLKLKTGRVKESGRSRKRFAENIQSLEASQGVLISSFRSAEIRQEFSCFKDSSDVAVFYTKENIKVAVYVANILNVSVDCIVNDANGNLQHGGGVAKMIADAAGPQLVQEGDTIIRKKGRIPVGVQVTTTAGRLPYRCVIHTVGPCWSDYQPHSLQKVKDCEESLYRAIYGCFCEAEKMGLSTIALPAVSSGIHAVPQDMCAVQYARAVIDYSRNSEPGKCLKEIHFIDKLSNLVTLMQDTFRIMIQNGKLPNYNTENYVISLSSCQGQILLETGRKVHRKQDFAASKSQYETTKPNELSPVYYESEEHFVFQVSVKPVVHIYQGNILNLRNMDAVVCPDNSRGTGVGMIASELSKKQRYKQHKEKRFRMMKPDLGDVVITFGEDNHFNTVVYVVIENNSPQKPGFMSTMKKSIDNILRKTNEWVNVKTIAMPLFGVKHGLLTEKSWTELFLDRFLAFCHEVKNPNLEEVHIIVDLFSRSTCSTVRKVFIDFADEVNNASLQPPAV